MQPDFYTCFHNNFITHVFYFSVSRLDEKESEMRKEYNKLHERYTEV